MSSAREEILRRIRTALGDSPGTQNYSSLPREYQQTGLLDRAERIDLFEDRLRDYGVSVFRCAEQDLPVTIRDVMNARGKRSLLIPRGFPKEQLPPSFEFRVDDQLTYEDLDRSEGVLTGCAIAIASTGTVTLRHSTDEGRRALTLIPDYHLCVVRGGQVVELPVEAVRIMSTFGTAALTTVSGPSATSDIEMVRIKGVHGPRVLDMILVI
jgi:L-lactate dehydrogenase complex protein LldG